MHMWSKEAPAELLVSQSFHYIINIMIFIIIINTIVAIFIIVITASFAFF